MSAPTNPLPGVPVQEKSRISPLKTEAAIAARLAAKAANRAKNVHIPVSDEYALGADPHGWQIKRFKSEDDWTAIRWYPTITAAAHGLHHLMLQTSGAGTLAELSEANKNALAVITEALAGFTGPELDAAVERIRGRRS